MSELTPDPFSTPSQPPPGYIPIDQPLPPSDGSLPQPTEPATGPPVRWGMGDAALGLLLANLFALVGGGIILAATGNLSTDGEELDLSLALTAVLQIPLWVGYLGVPIYAAKVKGNGVVADFGFRMRWYDVFTGIGAGLGTQIILIPLLYWPISYFIDIDDLSEPARELTDKADDPVGVVLLIAIVAIGAPIIEELFFRGLLLRSVQRRFGAAIAVAASSLIFGAIHFQLKQLPALALFGLVAALLTVKTDRLGPAIWAHVTFNATATALLLSEAVIR
jgi:hypothetical protein